jgi:single-strand DNA-binding protein
MYLNTATLTGFLGGDAETRTTKTNTTFTVFSLATKNSWKDRETGEWTSRTEWHRAVVIWN